MHDFCDVFDPLKKVAHTDIFIGGVLAPAIFVLILIMIPYVEPYLEFWRKDKSNPVGRRLRDRPITTLLFTFFMVLAIALIIIGQYFRGPQWEWVIGSKDRSHP